MKNKIFLRLSLSSLLLAGMLGACKDEFLEIDPAGVYTLESLTNKKGVEGMLIAAYAALDGRPETQTTGSTNWVWGSVAADDANKGTEPSDFNSINPIELYQQTAGGEVGSKWRGVVDGIGMTNQVLRSLKEATDISAADAARIEGEARFLRAFFHMEGRKVFGLGFPWIPETAITTEDYRAITNQAEIWPQIEADFKFAQDNLPGVQPEVGRANKWAAEAFLAKAQIFQNKYSEALPLLNEVMISGTTAKGVKYALNANFGDNFRIATKNSAETVFAIQYAINTGAGNNSLANYENNLNFPHGSGDKPGGCCGFFQPSQTLVNSYMTDATTGLPTFNPYTQTGVTSDYQLTSDQPFTPYNGSLDPRLDHTVGRRGIQYLDWGPHPGRSWIRQVTNGGPYSPKKNVHTRAELSGGTAGTGDWGQPANALSFPVMRYSDVILMAAEAEAQAGSLENALTHVNTIRTRAGSQATIDGLNKVGTSTSGPLGNYKVGLYSAFAGKEDAMKAIMEERKLELAMEGHRKFDLVRWGIAAETLNAYVTFEKTYIPKFVNAKYTAEDDYMPVPEGVISTSRLPNGTFNIKQNTGY
ncbi:RagB/SusD family nutrient uptake outer membrane protein [Adhaeribacter radiodurans]|uniref:RagB/SusD family nutrient uptake outer membrane protein n=1 Tax=Adhaeribacter radiodurans TaxID=2745197 RepID=A0A7L7LCZ5_9BACT|nr:RagB/SusD family nutrient uptake outer membrane protein [Adhaeribacter radiodurans]QMU30716.1 RagB/SusD family nutrient uptake outer membrane protein [Adhaeribacter radiodurans]